MPAKPLALVAILGAALLHPAQAAPEPPVLTVDASHVLRAGADKFVGLNLNYLRDADANRPKARPLNAALSEMGVRWLRYPGGEKSDFYLWNKPPLDKPAPTALGWYDSVAGVRMDFDAFIATARAVSAHPYVVVGYDTVERTGRTKEQWLANAVSWVRYSNITQKYGVTHWEIGNENWHNGTAQPEEMARIVCEFSRAMKAIDPTIQIGSSGSNEDWWRKYLPIAARDIDFLSLSHYNAWDWKRYDTFVQHPDVDLAEGARAAVRAIDKYASQPERARLRVIVAETNSKDYSEGGWPGGNTLGHAIVTFETLGRLMQEPRITSALVWTSRWINDDEAAQSQWYALGAQNQIMPTGRALSLWSRAQSDMVEVQGNAHSLRGYATSTPDKSALTVWIVNRGLETLDGVRVRLKSPVTYRKATMWRLKGTGPDDESPTWQQEAAPKVLGGDVLGLSCPGVSVSVVELKR